ncbi:Dyp-type peroxidase [Primorskyibacter sp. 2E233]|uniref:Dyp-type peroxidase n=1 Tax=Primorskyibacter sp. 2E233 TaxID=3413431 RepID=UPI003BF2A2D3
MDFTYLTVAVPFSGARQEAVDQILAEQGRQAYRGGSIRDALRGQGVHFLSITTVPEDDGHSAFLVLESSHDGGKAQAINVLARHIPETLTAILQAAQISVPSDLARFLRDQSIETGTKLRAVPGLPHRGAPGMTVDRIYKEEAFARRLREMVARDRSDGGALHRLGLIRARIADEVAFKEMMTKADVGFLAPAKGGGGLASLLGMVLRGVGNFFWPVLGVVALLVLGFGLWAGVTGGIWAGIGIAALTAVLALAALLAWIGALYVALRRAEKTDEVDDSPPDYKVLSEVMQIEDDGVVNHLAGISKMKPGRLRRLSLRLAFWVIAQLATRQFRPGFLGEIGTIHSARWVLVPGTDKLLFFSNYSGSWESYLEDFITKANSGLTGVWSNTIGFPRTSNLFFDGATDGDRFKRWARRQQRPSYFWYRAYPNTTAHQVRLHAAIRHGLLTASTEDEAQDWFDLFGSRPRRTRSLETDEIQKIVFGGMRRLQDGVFYGLRLPENTQAARNWLRETLPTVSFGDGKPLDSAHILALSATGLARLGLNKVDMAQFPVAFLQGMDDEKRAARVLMDTGEDEPARWKWGNGTSGVDLALMVVARPAQGLENAAVDSAAQTVAALQKHGGAVVAKIATRQLPKEGPVREPFGFVDGVSQPILRGSRRWAQDQTSRDVVEPGEFLLGYPDNRGFLPVSPCVPPERDPDNILPARTSKTADTDWPDFQRDTASIARDLGRNGSFMVVRQLEQAVEKFHQQSLDQADRLETHPGVPPGLSRDQRATWIRAKAVGRWPDGSSLTRHPHEPAGGWAGEKDSVPDNDFLHGQEDPAGRRCPFSAHIRRSNPRDSFEPGSEKQMGIVNRHRILRIGRPYDEGAAQGLLFMCLNADLERQFEFVQQTWAMSRHFHGLTEEVDAILGRGGKGGQLTVPTEAGPVIVEGFNDVVRMCGGGYFFLPGRSALRYLAG